MKIGTDCDHDRMTPAEERAGAIYVEQCRLENEHFFSGIDNEPDEHCAVLPVNANVRRSGRDQCRRKYLFCGIDLLQGSRRSFWVDAAMLIAILLISVTISLQLLLPGVTGTLQDDGVYVSTAKSIAEGHGYRLQQFPGAPPQTKYPIGYPFILSLIWRITPAFPQNVLAMKWLSILAGAFYLSLTYLFLVKCRYTSRFTAGCACLLSASVPGIAFLSTQLMSEMSFAVATLLCMWLLHLHLAREKSRGWQELILALTLVMPGLLRTIGFVFVPTALILLAMRKKPLKIVVCTTMTVVACQCIWMFSNYVARDPIVSYDTNYIDWWMRHGAPNELSIFSKNLSEWRTLPAELVGMGLLPSGLMQGKPLTHACALIGVLPWLLMFSCKSRTVLPWFLLVYSLVISLWPWPPGRFVAPMLPFLIAFTLVILSEPMRSWQPGRLGRCLLAAVASLLFITNVLYVMRLSAVTKDIEMPFLSIAQDGSAHWCSLKETAQWVRENTAEDDVIATTYDDALLYLYSGRRCLHIYELNVGAAYYGLPGDEISSARELSQTVGKYHPRYMIFIPTPGCEKVAKLIHQLSSDHPGMFNLVHVGSTDKRFLIWKIRYDTVSDRFPKELESKRAVPVTAFSSCDSIRRQDR